MAEEEAGIKVDADISEYIRVLKKIPGITDKEAKKAADNWAKQLKQGQIKAALQATKSAKKSSKAWNDSAGDTKAGLEGMKQAAEAFGGQVGAAAGVAEKLGRSFLESGKAAGPVGAAFGAVALGLAGVALAGVAVAKALFDVVASADEAIERLKEIEGTKPLPPATIEALDSWRQAALGAEASGERLKVVVAGELANAFEDVVPLIAAAADSLADFIQNTSKVKATVDEWQGVIRVATGVLSAGTTEAIRYQFALDEIGEEARESAKGVKDLSKETEGLADEQAKILDQGPRLSDFLKFQAEQERKLAKARAAAAKQRADDLREVNAFIKEEKAFFEGIRADREAEESAEIARIVAAQDAHKARILQLKEEADAREQLFKDNMAALAEQARVEREVDEARRQRLLAAVSDAQMLSNAAIGFAAELSAAQIQSQSDVANRASDKANSLKALLKETFDGEAEMRTASEQAAIEATRNELKANIQAREEDAKSARESARKLAKLQKQLGRLDVGVNTAVAIIKAFAMFGPPPSPAGLAAAAAATLAGATQLSVINRQKPPQFHTGNVPQGPQLPSFTSTPDERLVSQLPDESTINQRGTQALGPENIDQLNKTGSLGAMGTTVNNIVLDGRVIGRGVERGIERGTINLGDRGGPVGVQDVFGAG